MKKAGYTYASNRSEFNALPSSGKLLGLFTSSHMAYDLDRDAGKEPSLAEMTSRAIDQLKTNPNGIFLMVEGGRIDHALHETTARKALQDTVAFDDAIKAAIDKMQALDPGLKNTLIVVTADHDHTLVLNGYAARTGKTTDSNPGVLGLLRSYVTAACPRTPAATPSPSSASATARTAGHAHRADRRPGVRQELPPGSHHPDGRRQRNPRRHRCVPRRHRQGRRQLHRRDRQHRCSA
jgi:alkaline phosphatase